MTSRDSLVEARRQWLESLEPPDVSNVLLASNIIELLHVAEKWHKEYVSASSFRYDDEAEETAVSFDSYDTTPALCQRFYDEFADFRMPSLMSLAVMLACYFLLLLSYLVTRRARTERNLRPERIEL